MECALQAPIAAARQLDDQTKLREAEEKSKWLQTSPATLTTTALATALAATALAATALAASALAAAAVAALAAASLATAAFTAALASADVVLRYVCVCTERRLPGRRLWLAHCSVWRCGSVRHRHGLHRLRRTLHVPAVSASAIALTATALVASAADVVRRLVHLRQ